ncbi:protein kinase [Achlya hypogyna]|uniref:Protein kinase n=1 Tax=Achlya hypogyna TaxID=1202772 RepID=A0A1V9YJT2_ACHHY|nr:protein kinase [Achlya hypogyna]
MEILFELSTFRHFIQNLRNRAPIHIAPVDIGRNAYAVVGKGDLDGCAVALKRSFTNVTSREHLVRETHLLSGFKHPAIVHCLGATWRGAIDAARNELCCILEFMEGGNLEDCLAYNPSLEWFPTKLQWIYDIASALAYLHRLGFIHHDVDPCNVLIRGNHAKLCQFGQCLHETESLDEFFTNATYAAPEIAQENLNITESDIWSFGALLSKMDRHIAPYLENKLDMDALLTLQRAQELAEDRRLAFSDMCPPEVLALARDCLRLEPSERPTADELVARIEKIADEYDFVLTLASHHEKTDTVDARVAELRKILPQRKTYY